MRDEILQFSVKIEQMREFAVDILEAALAINSDAFSSKELQIKLNELFTSRQFDECMTNTREYLTLLAQRNQRMTTIMSEAAELVNKGENMNIVRDICEQCIHGEPAQIGDEFFTDAHFCAQLCAIFTNCEDVEFIKPELPQVTNIPEPPEPIEEKQVEVSDLSPIQIRLLQILEFNVPDTSNNPLWTYNEPKKSETICEIYNHLFVGEQEEKITPEQVDDVLLPICTDLRSENRRTTVALNKREAAFKPLITFKTSPKGRPLKVSYTITPQAEVLCGQLPAMPDEMQTYLEDRILNPWRYKKS